MLMVQTNAQPMKTTKLKGPPPIPPRPNQSVVAEALAKTRKAVAESKASVAKPRASSKQELNHNNNKSKTLDRSTSANQSSVSPKQNGLARVKSFIRDVINDRSSSSDEKKSLSSGQNSRRSSSDSCSGSTPTSVKKSSESLNSRAVKTCRQILVRSLSTSNKLDQDSKCKVSKSSSFAEKTLPFRKAPPPPLSPKPRLKPMRNVPVNVKTNSLERLRTKQTPDITLYSSPVDAKPPQTPVPEAPYATVEEVQEFDERLRISPSKQVNKSMETNTVQSTQFKQDECENNKMNSLERKTSRVTEMLISEILASRNNNKEESYTVIDKGKSLEDLTNRDDSHENKIMRDMSNHDMLIYELQTMRSQSEVPRNLEKDPSLDANEAASVLELYKSEKCESEVSEPNYANSSVSSVCGDDEYEQTYTYVAEVDLKSRLRKQFQAISTMSLQGLPPLPKSLSSFAEGEPDVEDTTPNDEKPPTDLDSQLLYLKKEMASLRQLDLSLLSELWTLSEAMASWRRQLERAPRLRPAPPPPPPPHYLRT